MHNFKRVFDINKFATYNLLAILVGGLLAALLMTPGSPLGIVRFLTYLTFFAASVMLATRFISIVRRSEDGKASLFVVASCFWWVSFAVTCVFILYLLFARAYGFGYFIPDDIQERIAYFFISGSAVGVMFKAITFRVIPKEWLQGTRVSAWPFTIFRRRTGA